MGYELRTWYPGAFYHITIRGNKRELYKEFVDSAIKIKIEQEAK